MTDDPRVAIADLLSRMVAAIERMADALETLVEETDEEKESDQ